MKKMIAGLMTCLFVFSVMPVFSASVTTFSDMSGHWSIKDVETAVERGYVAGYPDGTFKPDRAVNRGEFIKMATIATGIASENAGNNNPWYFGYAMDAEKAGVMEKNEFWELEWEEPITRWEMARHAMNFLGERTDTKDKYVAMAVERGLIRGLGNGELGVDLTTTRAQSLTVIERLLKIQAGEALPVDEQALEKATIEAAKVKDPFGREIRKTNLPANHENYLYINMGVPNERYELEFDDYYNRLKLPSEVAQYPGYDVKDLLEMKRILEQWGNQVLNVDYRTLDRKWEEKYRESFGGPGEHIGMTQRIDKYTKWAKENKIQIEGFVEADPSILYNDGTGLRMRVYAKFKIKSYVKDEGIFIGDLWYRPDLFKKNVWYEGHADVTMGSNMYYPPSMFKYSKVTSPASLIENSKYWAVRE